MKPYHINKKQILIMGCLGMFPLFSSAQDILSTSGTSRWDYSNSRVEREPGRDALDITFSVCSAKVLESSGLTVKRSVPFERWMADGRLVVREVSYGCAECGTNESEDIAFQAGIPLFGEKDYAQFHRTGKGHDQMLQGFLRL